jgi:diphosphomevalonate decarboxylase
VKKFETIKQILGEDLQKSPSHSIGNAFAPSNIALCKYWGKRDQELNLPVTSSLSVSLGSKGATTFLEIIQDNHDQIILNDVVLQSDSPFSRRLVTFLNLFRSNPQLKFKISLHSNIPIAAGLASSAAGFASVIKALDQLMGWQLAPQHLSILARLGSGSASRSLWQGFVEWHAGSRDDGMDSVGESLTETWQDMCIGLLIVSAKEKILSSRVAMQRTVTTSSLYSAWPTKVAQDLATLKIAIAEKNFSLLGQTAESNALTMHATMLSAWPPIFYSSPETISAVQKIWSLRAQGLEVYFTQDAGPNLKLIFLQKDAQAVQMNFPELEILQPFSN